MKSLIELFYMWQTKAVHYIIS